MKSLIPKTLSRLKPFFLPRFSRTVTFPKSPSPMEKKSDMMQMAISCLLLQAEGK